MKKNPQFRLCVQWGADLGKTCLHKSLSRKINNGYYHETGSAP